jgi:hypothetical protein
MYSIHCPIAFSGYPCRGWGLSGYSDYYNYVAPIPHGIGRIDMPCNFYM